MASNIKNLSVHDFSKLPDATGFKFGIVVSEYYHEITGSLLQACLETFAQQNVKPENIEIIYAPGTYELPSACHLLYKKNEDLDAIIAFGCVIKGDTDHDKYINQSVANALQDLSIKYEKPFLFGVLTPNTRQQALDRAGGKHGNKGVEVAVAALKMVALKYI
ncbi:MAG: 6,7-dimethyl-8-ribityllumazine synthase [Chitinophagales bacterium]